MKRGDLVRYTPLGLGKDSEIMGLLLSIESTRGWQATRRISLADFEGNKHQINILSDEEIKIVSHGSL